jgi:serine/threonine protein kinase
MSSTAPTSTIDDELSVRFLILDQLRGLVNAHGILFIGVRPG